MNNANPKLSDVTIIALAYPKQWQPVFKIMDVLTDSLDAIIEAVLDVSITEAGDLRLRDTTEVVLIYGIGSFRMRTVKIRTPMGMPEILIKEIESKYRLA